ncbi:MAG: hypothetical protein M1837_000142 [Sclerophora amabilis]|nr:MAG: hypothetical protein M1837_000142 [Sclerophora amabilis]
MGLDKMPTLAGQGRRKSSPDIKQATSTPRTASTISGMEDVPTTSPRIPPTPTSHEASGVHHNPVLRKGRQAMWGSQSSVGLGERTPSKGSPREFPLRARTKTMGEVYPEEAKTPFTHHPRLRMSSTGSSAGTSFSSDTGSPGSGSEAGIYQDFPSFSKPSPLAEYPHEPAHDREKRGGGSPRQRLFKSPPRNELLHRSTSASKAPTSPITTIPDVTTVFGLMKLNRGRMRGMLRYKSAEDDDWSIGRCYIDETLVSLVLETDGIGDLHRVIASDLRSSQVRSTYDVRTSESHLELCRLNINQGICVRPVPASDLDSWIAAFLYWQTSPYEKPQQIPQLLLPNEGRPFEYRRRSDLSFLKDASIIKVGKMMAWDPGIASSTPFSSWSNHMPSAQQLKVSSILRENGELKLYTDTEIDLIATVQLSQLSRSAIQRLDPSVLGEEFCIAILPQSAPSSTAVIPRRPVYLSMESRVVFEVWSVLLRAFARPELYYPEQVSDRTSFRNSMRRSSLWDTSKMDLFRIERSLSIRVLEARLSPPRPMTAPEGNSTLRHTHSRKDSTVGNYFSEILLDGEVRAKTTTRQQTNNPFWREDFVFSEIPGALPKISILFKKLVPFADDDTSGASISSRISDRQSRLSDSLDRKNGREVLRGRVDIRFENVGHGKETESWWPIVNGKGENLGEMLLRIRGVELPLLVSKDYDDLSELLHRFSNGLTVQIAQMLSGKLHRLSEIFLNIFQTSGHANDWLRTLIEEEFDGTYKDSTLAKFKFGKRMGSNESHDSSSDRELIRELGRSAPIEANLLFRGNNLLTKSLDLHLQRIGKEYLEETLRESIVEVDESDLDFEVDPNRIAHPHDLKRNWRNLTTVFGKIWSSIRESALRCPMELRVILRHVQACAEDRFELLRSVKYSSVSGFLFLRFFCPAVLNPRLFGLLKGEFVTFRILHLLPLTSLDNPRPKAQRALTLIAKSLQGLGNMSSFGIKESWMEPMNQCLTSHRQGFKDFIDAICTLPMEYPSSIPPSYATPTTIIARMTPVAREGCPSLPYLIDRAQNFAALINIWIEHAPSITAKQTMEGDLLKFHLTCIDLHHRTQDLFSKATQTQQSQINSPNWGEIFQQVRSSAVFSTLGSPKPQSPSSSHPPPPSRSSTPTESTFPWHSARLLKFKVRSDDDLSTNSSSQPTSNTDSETSPPIREHHHTSRPKLNDLLSSLRKKSK